MDRRVLRDDQWERIAPLVPGKVGDAGRSGADNRLFVEAVLWIVRVGAPWRDLPEEFGNWNSVFQRFRRWVKAGVFDRIFEALSDDADFEYVIVDGTIVRVHQHGTGAKGGTHNQAIGRSRGGLTIVALVDALSCGLFCCRTRQRRCRPASDGSRLRRPAGGQGFRQRRDPR